MNTSEFNTAVHYEALKSPAGRKRLEEIGEGYKDSLREIIAFGKNYPEYDAFRREREAALRDLES